MWMSSENSIFPAHLSFCTALQMCDVLSFALLSSAPGKVSTHWRVASGGGRVGNGAAWGRRAGGQSKGAIGEGPE